MKIPHHHRIHLPRCRYLALGLLLVAGFGASLAAAPQRGKKQPSMANLPPPEMHRDSSRFFTGEQKDDFVAVTAMKLGMQNRDIDPFALPQDPDSKPAPKVAELAKKPEKAPEKIPFSQIINRIRITTVMPAERRFMIDSRAFNEGSELRLNFGGETLRAKILSIRSDAIVMRNLDTRETATLHMNLLPAGMQLGQPGLRPDRLFENEQDAPIILDGSNETGE